MKHKLLIVLLVTLLGGCTSNIIITHSDTSTLISMNGSARYILLPIEDDAPSTRIDIIDSDSLNQRLYIRLARNKVDYYVPFESSRLWPESKMIADLDSTAVCWTSIKVANKFTPKEDPLRPLWHHTPPYGWMNDPNGMFYLDGKWHLFYQYNPYGNRHGNISWGHSVSTDLVNWEHLPVVLYPDSLGTVASGSCIVDKYNSAGYGENAILAFYTGWNNQVQCMAYSTDGGMTFTKYEGNPVLTSDERNFRDPKLLYHHDTQRWIMVLAVGDHMEFYSSFNLKEWHYESSFGQGYGGHGGVWECPDLFALAVDGNPANTKWVLISSINPGGPWGGSATQYFVGDFDGHQFSCDTPPSNTQWIDFGKDNYAGVTWHNAPDNRVVFLGWMSNWYYCGRVPTSAFRSANTLPRDLSLYSHNGHIYLGSKPSPEIESTFTESQTHIVGTVNGTGNPITVDDAQRGYCIEFSLNISTAESCGIALSNIEGDTLMVTYNTSSQMLTIDRTRYTHQQFSEDWNKTASVLYGSMSHAEATSNLDPKQQIFVPRESDSELNLSLWVDRCSVECFEQRGRFALTTTLFPASQLNIITPFAEGECHFDTIRIRTLTAQHDR